MRPEKACNTMLLSAALPRCHTHHLTMCCVGPRGTGLIQNGHMYHEDADGTGSVSVGASAGVSDDQDADSGMHANGGYHHTSRFGRSAPMLHERMQSTNSSSPLHHKYEDGVDEEQSVTSEGTQ